jgi:uncharacterized Zn finger protein
VHWYPRYVPVDGQRARAVSEMHELRSRGVSVQPIEIRGRTIARSFWGRHWCEHLESFSEYAARLAHGRAYVRNGSICHLAVDVGGVDAMVIGSALYRVAIRIRRLPAPAWMAIRNACVGRIGTLSELYEGRLPDRVVAAIVPPDAGLFPQPGEIVPSCECPDRAPMCKHAAAVLSGIGSRLDDSPELLFRLRGVDETELIADGVAPTPAGATADVSAGDDGKPTVDVDPGSGNGATAPYRPGATSNATEPAAFSNAPARGTPTPADPAPAPRRVKKTLTYRPSTPTASLPLALPAGIAGEAAGFQPTGELVGELRERCGCSVAEFADLIQVTAPTVRRWETTSGPLSLHARPWEALRALHVEIQKHEG